MKFPDILKRSGALALAALLLVNCVGCVSKAPDPAPVSDPSSVSASSADPSPSPTATPEPTATPTPTATPAPTATEGAKATGTPTPTQGADVTPDPTLSPAPTASVAPTVTTAPEKPGFVQVTEDYFKDALFIGDSRTEGLHLYAPFSGADYFCASSMNSTKLLGSAKTSPTQIEISGVGKVTLEQLLQKKTYGKIYFCLGINELGSSRTKTMEKYDQLLGMLRTAYPDAVIFLQANLHVNPTKAKDHGYTVGNKDINDFNAQLAQKADGVHIIYLDPNAEFDDADGNMNADYTGDGVHLKAKSCKAWAQWLMTKGIVK